MRIAISCLLRQTEQWTPRPRGPLWRRGGGEWVLRPCVLRSSLGWLGFVQASTYGRAGGKSPQNNGWFTHVDFSFILFSPANPTVSLYLPIAPIPATQHSVLRYCYITHMLKTPIALFSPPHKTFTWMSILCLIIHVSLTYTYVFSKMN